MRYVLSFIFFVYAPATMWGQALSKEDFCIDGVCIDDSVSRAYEVFGIPQKVERDTLRDEPESFLFYDGLVIWVNSSGRIFMFVLKSKVVRTHRGITIGDSATTIRSKYGKTLEDHPSGIVFTTEEQLTISFSLKLGKVDMIHVGYFSND